MRVPVRYDFQTDVKPSERGYSSDWDAPSPAAALGVATLGHVRLLCPKSRHWLHRFVLNAVDSMGKRFGKAENKANMSYDFALGKAQTSPLLFPCLRTAVGRAAAASPCNELELCATGAPA